MMTRLTSDLHPLLTEDVLKALFSKSVFTTLAFVRRKNVLLANITGLQYDQIRKIKDKILSKCSSSLKRGFKYYQDAVKSSSIISSGIAQVDALLRGGFSTGNIYEFCGFEASGKTQLCMSSALRICQYTSHKVLFIDTKYDISVKRLSTMLANIQNEADIKSILEKIKLCHSTTACKLLNDLHCLKASFVEKFMEFKVVIIDSLSVIFQTFYNVTEGLSILNCIANFLTFLASEYHLVILVTNFVSSWSSVCHKSNNEYECAKNNETPALGRYWAHIPNTTINIKRIGCADECYLTISKSRTLPKGGTAIIKISNSGIS